MESARVESILNWPEPRSYRDIQVFLGFANFYRRFIEGFARISSALSGMLEGGKKSKFTILIIILPLHQHPLKIIDHDLRARFRLLHHARQRRVELADSRREIVVANGGNLRLYSRLNATYQTDSICKKSYHVVSCTPGDYPSTTRLQEANRLSCLQACCCCCRASICSRKTS